MATRRTSRQAARRRSSRAHSKAAKTLYHRRLRYEPLEDRRLLALVTVTTLSDTIDFNDGVTSLREAIFATNLVSGADTIDFAPALTAGGPKTILLGQGELKITDDLTINGPGAERLTIDGSLDYRIFNITKGSSADVTLSQLTLTRGLAHENGGAIVAMGDGLHLNDVVITDSIAGNGGAVAVMSGTLEVLGSAFSGNQAPGNSGGAIYTLGPAMIVDTQFNANSARTGGAIAAHHTLELNRTAVADNSAVFGGGIWIGANGSLLATGSIVSKNESFDGLGGGIGGEGPVTIVDSQILNNISSGHGGGGIGTRGDVTVENSVISANQASTSGGGISTGGALVVRASVISGNSAGTLDNSFAAGGGIYLAATRGTSTATIESSTISRNFASSAGGGISTRSTNRMINVLNSTISGNTARTGGGMSGGQITLNHSTVTDNSAIFIRGDLGMIGGINASLITLNHAIVAGNHEAHSFAPDLFGSINKASRYSLIGDNKGTSLRKAPVGSPDANGNLIGGPVHGVIDPLLGPLADNGGPTFTHALLPGSPAINAGDLNAVAGADGVPLFDQRGEPFSRVVNGRIDIGAFEYQEPADLNLLVDTLADESDSDYSRGDLSLREAIALANLWPSTDTIRFDSALTASGPATILLTMGELPIKDDVSIIGLGTDLLIIDASGNDPTPDVHNGDGSRVFNIDDGSSPHLLVVFISGLTLTGGDVTGEGGAIRSFESMSLAGVSVRNNAAMRGGGGVFASLGGLGSVAIVSSDVTQNETRRNGGGGITIQLRDGPTHPSMTAPSATIRLLEQRPPAEDFASNILATETLRSRAASSSATQRLERSPKAVAPTRVTSEAETSRSPATSFSITRPTGRVPKAAASPCTRQAVARRRYLETRS